MRQQYGNVRDAIFHTLVASANAYLGALKKLMIRRQRGKPEAWRA